MVPNPCYKVFRLDRSSSTVPVGFCPPIDVKASLLRYLRPGDRVISVYPNGSTSNLEALVELVHRSWFEEGPSSSSGFGAVEEWR